MEKEELQLGSKQDHSFCFNLDSNNPDEEVYCFGVFDGHGHSCVIDIIRGMDLPQHFSTEDPATSIQSEIQRLTQSYPNKFLVGSSGSTLVYAKVTRNILSGVITILIGWVGDSSAYVFLDDEFVYENQIHHCSNKEELQLQQSKGLIKKVEKSLHGFKIISPEEIKHLASDYAIFANGTKLAMTRSLGHGTDVPKNQQTHTITASINQRIRIVTCSDGISDMLDTRFHMTQLKTCSASELVRFAEESWKKEWKYYSTTTKFPDDNWDDSSCAVWEQK